MRKYVQELSRCQNPSESYWWRWRKRTKDSRASLLSIKEPSDKQIQEACVEAPGLVREILNEVKTNGVGDNKNILVELNIEQTRHNEIQLLGNGTWTIALGGARLLTADARTKAIRNLCHSRSSGAGSHKGGERRRFKTGKSSGRRSHCSEADGRRS